MATPAASAPNEKQTEGLSAEEEQFAQQIIFSDPRVSELIGDRAFRIERLSPWFAADGEKIGAIGLVRWDDPATLTYEWLTVVDRDYFDHFGPALGLLPYREDVRLSTVHGLRALMVSLAIQEQRVVGIEPPPASFQLAAYDRIEPIDPAEVDLTSEHGQAILQVLDDAEALQSLIAERGYQVDRAEVRRAGEVSLAVATVRFEEPQRIEAEWRILVDLDRETGDYETRTVRFAAELVDHIDVTINLDSRELISVEPGTRD